ncbi:LysR family transcriptional regulator [uncultured Bradyrhizobium sp.]|jgi:DNA-binding transcriptional LysR family regulator|uniref:LysR family transcriptional regulator n=1 Tax=uncultured Bradyrhizobium sp. TaxID=199684 RepID=UPI00260BE64B|nr:LysR family transcriptional regulator [uncultured Bradyrhizobium sp.]
MQWHESIGRRLRLKDLHTLQTVAEVGSMAKASRRLGLSQPAISKAITDMEHAVGAALLDRTSRGVELTECGRLLVDRTRVVFDEIKLGVAEVVQRSDPAQGFVAIGTTEPVTAIVTEIIEHLVRRYPGIKYHITIGDRDALEHALRQRMLDLAITRWSPLPAADDLSAEVLFRSSLAVMAERKHPLLRSRKKLKLAELMQEQWTLSPPDTFLGRTGAELFRRHNLPLPPTTVTTISIYMRLNLLASSRFITLLPMQILRMRSSSAWLRALNVDLGDTSAPIASITLKGRRAGGAVKLFQEASRDVCKALVGVN